MSRHKTRQLYSLKGRLCVCGKPAQVRHHRDGRTDNMHPSNVIAYCRSCHVKYDPKIIAH